MAAPLYLKLLEELRPVQSLKALVLMLQNEPLMDEDPVERVRQARMRFGKSVCISIVTNGELLSPGIVKGLYEAGLDQVEISLDALTRETYRRVRAGLDFDRGIENTHKAIATGGAQKTIVRFLVQKDNVHEQKAFNAYWVRKGARVMFQDMTNRAGALRRYRLLRPDGRSDWYTRLESFLLKGLPCVSGPFDRLNVLSDGRVLACCQDWRHDFILGDLSSQSLTEIWTGSPAAFCREMLWHGQFEKSTLCATCSLRLVFPGTSGKKR